jgi:4-hydroxy-tetrahydrodipicolinate synthase
VPTIRYVKVEGIPQGPTISDTIRQSDGRLAVFCGWGGVGVLDALERGAVGSMPAPNFTRLFAEVQRCFDQGDVPGAAARLHAELPFVVWTMQSVDYSVAAAKEELRRRGIFRSAHQRQPGARLDAVSLRQLQRWLDARLGTEPR